MLRNGGALAFPPLERQPLSASLSLSPSLSLSLSDRDRAEMLYHDHPVLIKPYQIYVSEQESQEVGTCTCMFYCQCVFFLMDSFEWFFHLISADVVVISNELIAWYHMEAQFASSY